MDFELPDFYEIAEVPTEILSRIFNEFPTRTGSLDLIILYSGDKGKRRRE